MSCPHCPCADVCTASPAYCGWAAKDPPDPVKIRHICDASRARREEQPRGTTYPSLLTMAGNALGAAARFLGAGCKIEPAEEQARRLEICRSCEKFIAADQRCSLCGCWSKFKAKLASEHCPLDPPKW
jgi:hypothetical protein